MLYNLWLGLNIAYEILLPMLWLLVLLAVVWSATLVLALVRAPKGQWRKTLPTSGAIGAIAMVLAFVLFPGVAGSSFADVNQFADWLFAIGTAVGIGVALWVLTWPALTWLKKSA